MEEKLCECKQARQDTFRRGPSGVPSSIYVRHLGTNEILLFSEEVGAYAAILPGERKFTASRTLAFGKTVVLDVFSLWDTKNGYWYWTYMVRVDGREFIGYNARDHRDVYGPLLPIRTDTFDEAVKQMFRHIATVSGRLKEDVKTESAIINLAWALDQ